MEINVTKTKGGIEYNHIQFNATVNLYLGIVKDRWSSDPNRPWTTCKWKRNGKCINRNRPELDIDVTSIN